MNATHPTAIRAHRPPTTDCTYLVIMRDADGNAVAQARIQTGNHEIALDRALEQFLAQGYEIADGTQFDSGQADALGFIGRRRRYSAARRYVWTWTPVTKGSAS